MDDERYGFAERMEERRLQERILQQHDSIGRE